MRSTNYRGNDGASFDNIYFHAADFFGGRHGLDKNPWRGKIKVREELKWLEKYGGGAGAH